MIQEAFGELRSLMALGTPDLPTQEAWKALLLRTWRRAPQAYAQEWVAYLSPRRDFWAHVCFDVTSLIELETWAQVAPFAPLRLLLARQKLSQQDIVSLASSHALSHVQTLYISKSSLQNKPLRTLLASPYLRHVQHLTLRGCEIDGALAHEIGVARGLRALSSLDLSRNRLGDGGVDQLLDTLDLSELHTLHLSHNEIQYAGARAIAHAPLHALRHLHLGGNKLTHQGLEHLIDAPHPLQTLTLPACDLEEPSAIALSQRPRIEGLTRLNLSDNPLGEAGCAAVLCAPILQGVTDLDLSWCHFEGAHRALEHAHVLTDLRRLALNANDIGQDGAMALATTPHLQGLRDLEIWGNPLGDAGAKAIASASFAPTLERLNVRSSDIGSQGISAIAASMSGLERLLVGSNALGNAGLTAITHSSWPNLVDLNLCNTQISMKSIPRLLNATGLGALRRLDLAENKLTAYAAEALANSTLLPQLTMLDLGWNQLGDAGVRALLSTRATAGLRRLDLTDNQLGDDAVLAIAQATHLGTLLHLSLSNSDFGAPGGIALADAEHLSTLMNLNVPTSTKFNRLIQASPHIGAVATRDSTSMSSVAWWTWADAGEREPEED